MKAKPFYAVATIIGVFCSLFTMSAFAEAKSVMLSCTGYTGTTTLTNFQALVKLAEGVGGFSYADSAANGADLWFTDSANNVIPHEVDTWNTSDDSFVWVRIPEVVPVKQGVTVFTMHWGDLAAKQTASENVWKNYNDGKGGFAGVWHMGTASGTANEPDASGNGLDAVPTVNYGTGDLTAMVMTPGIVGNGRVNQTADSYVQGLKVPDYSSHVTDASKFTISGWWSATALNLYPRFASAEGATHYWAVVGYNNDGGSINRWKKIQGVYSNGEVKNGGSVTSAFAIDSFQSPNWVYLTVVWDGTTLTAYSNGAQKYQKTGMVAQTALNTGFMIGGDSAAASKNPAWRGYYDEVRMYDGAQTADRVKADYDTMNSPDAFLAYPSTATWTGAANDGDGTNPQNWECSNNGVAVDGQLPNATYRIQSCTLSGNCDWSGLGTAYLANGTIIEMNGHSLTLPVIYGSGTVQNMAEGAAAELTLSVSSDWTNTDTAFSGNLKLVKTGTGTFTSSKAQTYSGGTIVAAGTARPPTRTSASDVTYSWGSFKAFGPGEITVLPNATFDVRGQYGYCEIITLAGGTYASSGFTGRDDSRTDQSGVWRLTADSSANITQSLTFGNAGNDHLFNLNGHTFTVNVSGGAVYFNSGFSYADNPGTMVLKGAGYGISIFEDATIWATTVTFRVSTRVNLSENVQFHMLDYIAEHTVNVLYAKGGSQLYVYGTFKPNTANSYFVGPQMQDGATVDLSEMTGPWSVKSGGANLTTCKYVTFANGATVNVNLGSRKVSTSEAIMTWDAESKPANLATLTFKGVFNDRTVTLSKREDGLYMPRGLVIIVQ